MQVITKNWMMHPSMKRHVVKSGGLKFVVLMLVVILMMGTLSGCGAKSGDASKLDNSSNANNSINENSSSNEDTSSKNQGTIYLVGEMHGKKAILDRELELWGNLYENEGMRHLFIETAYYTAELLNLWMQDADDTQLDMLYSDWEGTACHSEDVKAFYQEIKKRYPETIFHGTDVGHQYDTTGERYLAYLEDHQMKDSDAYIRTKEVIKQGKLYYGHSDDAYREEMMIENFKWAFDRLENASIMGIYGAYHIGVDVPKDEQVMVVDLKETYGERLTTEDLTGFVYLTKPISTETMRIDAVDYEASYFGKVDLSGFKDYAYREFWRLEGAYDVINAYDRTGDYLPHDNYPMVLHADEAYLIRYTKQDGTVEEWYYVTQGDMKGGKGKTYQVEMP